MPIPQHIYNQLFRPAGRRPQKLKPYWELERSKNPSVTGYRYDGSTYDASKSSGSMSWMTGDSSMPKGMAILRYFSLKTGPLSRISEGMCRACRVAVYGETSMRAHYMYSTQMCNDYIDKAIALVRRDDCCVVCDIKTYRHAFGVPLCSKQCSDAWMYSSADRFSCWRAALKLAGWED